MSAFEDEVAEPVAVAALARIDDGRRPLVLDERGAGDAPARSEGDAQIAWHRGLSGLAEVHALLAHGRQRAHGLDPRKLDGGIGDARGQPQVDALDALARRVAVQPAVPGLERRAEDGEIGIPADLDLVVLARVAQVDASPEGDAVRTDVLFQERRHALRLQLAEGVVRALDVPGV